MWGKDAEGLGFAKVEHRAPHMVLPICPKLFSSAALNLLLRLQVPKHRTSTTELWYSWSESNNKTEVSNKLPGTKTQWARNSSKLFCRHLKVPLASSNEMTRWWWVLESSFCVWPNVYYGSIIKGQEEMVPIQCIKEHNGIYKSASYVEKEKAGWWTVCALECLQASHNGEQQKLKVIQPQN